MKKITLYRDNYLCYSRYLAKTDEEYHMLEASFFNKEESLKKL